MTTTALRKSSEGPIPWAFRQQQLSDPNHKQQSSFSIAQHHQQNPSSCQYLLGPGSQPPVRRASLQHQKLPDDAITGNGEGSHLDQHWPLPMFFKASSSQNWGPSTGRTTFRWDSGSGSHLAAIDHQSQKGHHLPNAPNNHRRSQPQLCHSDSQQDNSPHQSSYRPQPSNSNSNSAFEHFPQQRFVNHRFSSIANQKIPSQPMLNGTMPSSTTPSAGTPPRPRRQLPPLISQSSLGSASPHGSPRFQQRKFGCVQQNAMGTPPSGRNSPATFRKGSVGPVYDEDFGTFGHHSQQFYGTNSTHRHPDVGISAGELYSPEAIVLRGGQNASGGGGSGGGHSIRGVERRIHLRRCPQSDLASRFQRHHYPSGEGGSRGSSFSGSNESTPTRTMGGQQGEEELIDPVYLALKQATAKYGTGNGGTTNGGNGSRTGSRRNSQCALGNPNTGHLFDSATPSPRNLSQTSLQDSGYSGGGFAGDIGSSRSRLIGSTPHLHGIGGIGGQTTTTGGAGGQIGQSSAAGGIHPQKPGQGNGISGGRRPKLSEKMKSLSLDCEGMPAPVQAGLGRNQYYRSKPIRSARGFANSGDSFEDALERSVSPPSGRPFRRLPPAPPQQQATAPQSARLLPQTNGGNAATSATAMMPPVAAIVAPLPLVGQSNGQSVAVASIGSATTSILATSTTPPSTTSATTTPRQLPIGTHVVIHEYIYGECQLYLGDRLVVVDNGDPDWKHGFRVNDRLEQLYTFPSTCVAAFQPQEQPMRLLQNCNLVEQKLRLYRDQVVFVQPNSLRDDGRVLIRNEHGTFAYCPLQFLMLM